MLALERLLWRSICLPVHNAAMLRWIVVTLVALLLSAAAPTHTLLIERTGQAPRELSIERIAALKSFTQQVPIEHADRSWTGPLLWDVLADAGAVDPAKPADAVHLSVRVIGADGWTAVFGLAEMSPEFAGKPIQLADQMNAAPIPGQGLRLVVPNEHRGGRSVRDVVRIEVQ
jgi:hypothetical protein